MSYYTEKLFLGVSLTMGALLSYMGMALTEGETRFLFVTLFASTITAGFLVLVFKRAYDPIRIVVGRCGLAMLGGIFGTQPAIHFFKLGNATGNAITLGGISAACTAAMFLIGFAALRLVERSSDRIVRQLADKWFPGVIDDESTTVVMGEPQKLDDKVITPAAIIQKEGEPNPKDSES